MIFLFSLIFITSCYEEDDYSITEVGTPIESRSISSTRSAERMDRIITNLTKLSAYKWRYNDEFKGELIKSLFQSDGRTEDVLPLDFFDGKYFDQRMLEEIKITQEDYYEVINELNDPFSSLVFKVPDWTHILWGDDLPFSYSSMETQGFQFVARTFENYSNSVAYKYGEEGEEIAVDINSKSYPSCDIPIVVRMSENYIFINREDFSTLTGYQLFNVPEDTDAHYNDGDPCDPAPIWSNHSLKENGEWVFVHYINLINDLQLLCDEICDNGLDDNYDGNIDEDCPLPFFGGGNGEICENGIDDDGDGLIDADDPDCCDFYSPNCKRNCIVDQTILHSMKFQSNTGVNVKKWFYNPSLTDQATIAIKRYNTTGLSVNVEKSSPFWLYGDCNGVSTNKEHFFIMEKSSTHPGQNNFIVAETCLNGKTYYTYVIESAPVKWNLELVGEWDPSISGSEIAFQILATELSIVTNIDITDKTTIKNEFKTETTVKVGEGGGQNGSGGFSAETSNSSTLTYEVEQEVDYEIDNNYEKDLGRIELRYCEDDYTTTDYDVIYNCDQGMEETNATVKSTGGLNFFIEVKPY